MIDFGLVKEVFFDPQTNLESLKLQWISKASAVQVRTRGKTFSDKRLQTIQRQGRAGRVAPGMVFRMYTVDFYNNHMSEYSASEMLRCPLESLVLKIKVGMVFLFSARSTSHRLWVSLWRF